MLRRAQPDVYIGLDISPGRLKLVGLSPGPDGPVIVCAADEEMISPGRGVRFDAAEVGAAAGKLLSRFRVRPRSVALALGPGEAVARRMTVVDQDREQVLAALSLQLGQALGAEVVSPRVGFAMVRRNWKPSEPTSRITVFAAAARPEAVLAQQRAVSAAGWEQGPVTTTAVALVNAWRACRPRGSSQDRAVLLHVGEAAALWVVLDGDEPVALDAPLVGVGSARGRDWAAGTGLAGEALTPVALAEWTGRLKQEIARGLQPMRGEAVEGGGTEVWLTGGGACLPGFVEALESALSVPVRTFDPLSELSWDGAADVSGPAVAPAFGAALQAMAGPDSNLLAIDLKVSQSPGTGASGPVPLAAVARSIAFDRALHGLAAAAVLLWLTSVVLAARQREAGAEMASREVRVIADSAAVATAMARSELLASRRRSLGELADAAGRLDRSRDAAPRLMIAISGAIPDDAWVSDLIADGENPASGELSFRILGFAASSGVADAFAQALARNSAGIEAEVVRTEAVTIGRSPAVRFEIQGRSMPVPVDPGAGGGVR